jgi:hypothetical protein
MRCRAILSRSRSTRRCTCCHAGVSIYRLRRFRRCCRNARTAAKRTAMTRTHIRDMAVALGEFANFTQAAWPIHGLQIKVRSSSARSAPSPPPPAVAQSRPGSGASSLRLGDPWSAYDSMQRPLALPHEGAAFVPIAISSDRRTLLRPQAFKAGEICYSSVTDCERERRAISLGRNTGGKRR